MTTWNPADKAASIALSAGNTVATTTALTAGAVRTSGNAYSTGKRYFEITATPAYQTGTRNDQSIGIANAAETLTLAQQLGGTKNSAGFYSQFNQDVFINGVILLTAGGDNVGTPALTAYAFDFSNGKAWYSTPAFRGASKTWNDDVLANQNPATGAGGIPLGTLNAGPWMIAIGVDNTVNVGIAFKLATGGNGVPLGLAVPAGYTAWDPSGAEFFFAT